MHSVKTSTLFFPYSRRNRALEAFLRQKWWVKSDLEHKGGELFLV